MEGGAFWRKIVPFLVFSAGFGLALVFWNRINLPFCNPWEVVGSYTAIGLNPNTEVVRFLLTLLLPAFFLLIYHFAFGQKEFQKELPLPEYSDHLPGYYKGALLLFSVVFALNIGIEKYLFDYFHDGESLGPAISFYAGQTPYKDYLFLHGFFQDPWRSVLAFELFGRSISSLEIIDTLLKIITSGVLFFLIYRLFRFNRIALFLVVISVVILGISNRLWTHMLYEVVPVINHQSRDICTFGFLIVLTYLYEVCIVKKPVFRKVFGWSFVWYLIAFGSYLYSVDRAYYLSAASLILGFLLIVFVLGKKTRVAFIGGGFLGFTVAAMVFARIVGEGLPYFFDYYFKKLPAFKELVDGLPYDITEPPFFLTLLLIAMPISWLVNRFYSEFLFVRGRNFDLFKRFIKSWFLEISLSLLVVFYFRSALGRSDYYHIAYVSVVIYLLFFFVLFGRVMRQRLDKLSESKILQGVIHVSFLLIFLLGFFRLFLNDQYLLKANFPVGVPDEVYLKDDYEQAIEFLKDELGPEDNFYTLTNELCWYYFIDKPCPSRHQLINFTSPSFYQKELIHDLDQQNVRLILYNNEDPVNHFDGVAFRDRVPLVTAFVHEDFEFYRKIGRQEIWKRKE